MAWKDLNQIPAANSTPLSTPYRASRTEPAIVKIRFCDLQLLRSCYMPFLRYGGIFVPGMTKRRLREPIFAIVSLPGSDDEGLPCYGILCQVAWLTQESATGTRQVGTGLHFDADTRDLRHHIEKLLASQTGPCLSHTL